MPIHIDIRVNDEHVRTVHIGRDERFAGQEEEHTYRVTDKTMTTRADYWDMGSVAFEHKYSDGVEVCVRKGLEALYG